MFLFVLSVIVVVAALTAVSYFNKNSHHNEPFVFHAEKPSNSILQPVCKEEKDIVKVIVTYNDGTKETFVNEDGEINVTDGGLLTIRPDEEHCITISPFAFKKVEEIHE